VFTNDLSTLQLMAIACYLVPRDEARASPLLLASKSRATSHLPRRKSLSPHYYLVANFHYCITLLQYAPVGCTHHVDRRLHGVLKAAAIIQPVAPDSTIVLSSKVAHAYFLEVLAKPIQSRTKWPDWCTRAWPLYPAFRIPCWTDKHRPARFHLCKFAP
jgi:hypothetical protein